MQESTGKCIGVNENSALRTDHSPCSIIHIKKGDNEKITHDEKCLQPGSHPVVNNTFVKFRNDKCKDPFSSWHVKEGMS